MKKRAIYIGLTRLNDSTQLCYGMTGWAIGDKFYADGDSDTSPWYVGWDEIYYPKD